MLGLPRIQKRICTNRHESLFLTKRFARRCSTGIHGELIKAASAGRLKLKQLEHDNSTATPQVSNPYQSPAPRVIEQGSHFVATLPGAYLITWKELWPIKPIVARMKYAKDRKVRRAAGFPK